MWHARPLMDRDIDTVASLVNACEYADTGRARFDAPGLRAELSGVNRERDAVVVVQRGRIIGWGLVCGGGYKRRADVIPDARGRGVGSWLLRWSVWRAQSLGTTRMGQTIDDARTDVTDWLAGQGYTPRYTAWALTAPAATLEHGASEHGASEHSASEHGASEHSASQAEPHEVDAVLDLLERTFSALADRWPVTVQQWRARTVDRGDGDLIVVRAGGRPVGAAFLVGHDDISVSVLAVDADHRRRGVARQLLAAARTTAHDRGAAQVRMTTDCNATALEIYQRLGMTVERTFTHWAVDVPPARRG